MHKKKKKRKKKKKKMMMMMTKKMLVVNMMAYRTVKKLCVAIKSAQTAEDMNVVNKRMTKGKDWEKTNAA